jgi:two-component system, NtrC family, response regulator PilR
MSPHRVLVVDDERSMRDFLSILLSREGYVVETVATAEDAMVSFEKHPHDLVLTDLSLPGRNGMDLLRDVKAIAARGTRDTPVIVITAFGTTESAVEAMKAGALDYIMKPFNNDELKLVVRRALELGSLEEENRRLKAELHVRPQYADLVGSSAAMQRIYALIERVKDTHTNCLILGESGTGKEMVARAIHFSGARATGPFVAINCGAIPDTLIESELFGYKRGAFTGANRDKTGLFDAADGGTLFLDEVGEMPLMSQVKVLRAIQERKITPVGGVEEHEVTVRLLAATNRDLEEEVRKGSFRDDLFYRLNVVSIEVPPLRERRDDILDLARLFLTRYSQDYRKNLVGFTADAVRRLKQYDYPGNVRELQNIVERSVAMSEGSRIGLESLPDRFRSDSFASTESTVDAGFPADGVDLERELAALERGWIQKALEAAGGNKTRAADLLGLSFRSFRYRLQKLGMAE